MWSFTNRSFTSNRCLQGIEHSDSGDRRKTTKRYDDALKSNTVNAFNVGWGMRIVKDVEVSMSGGSIHISARVYGPGDGMDIPIAVAKDNALVASRTSIAT
jgi:hypothetical protein